MNFIKYIGNKHYSKLLLIIYNIFILMYVVNGQIAVLFLFLIYLIIILLVPEKAIVFGLSSIPFIGVLRFNGLPLINLILLFSILRVMFPIRIKNHSQRTFLIMICFLAVYDIVHYFFINLPSISFIIEVIVYFSIYLTSTISTHVKKAEAAIYYNAFILGSIGSAIFGLVSKYIKFKTIDSLFVINNTIDRFSGASEDPNYFAFMLVMSIIFTLYLIEENRNKILLKYFLIVFFTYMGLLTQSRIYIVLILLVYGLRGISILTFKIKLKANTVIIICLTLLFISLYSNNIMDILGNVISRFETDSVSDLTSGRNIIFSNYLDYYKSSPLVSLFGIGIIKYNIRSGMYIYAHNLYIELLVSFGIIGLILVFIMFLLFAYKYKISSNGKKVLFVLLVFGITMNVLEVESFVYFTICCLKLNSKERVSSKV